MKETNSIEALWKDFISSSPLNDPTLATSYQAWSFGDSPQMANELAALVLSGKKTATASLQWVYSAEDEALPQIGEYNIILSGNNSPVCITKTTEIKITPFNQVGEKFAFDEGEGDQSLAYWRKVHWDFFSRECHTLGKEPTERMQIVCERFTLVYSPN